jgi:23S rRNA (cytidine2498-2'-O)-methyltransferase
MTDEKHGDTGSSAQARGLLLYCRAGFESECAQEIAAFASARGLHGHVRAQRDSAVVEFVLAQGVDAAGLARSADAHALIFARQCLVVFAQLQGLPAHDRVTPILAALRACGLRFADAFVEAPDTNAGKELATFCRGFGSALIGAMKRASLIDPGSRCRLHAFFSQSDTVHLCVADLDSSTPWPQGIPRLKFPRDAPSRSTLKLDEAFFVLMSEPERARWLKAGMNAVDLGAAPGGWTWQLVRRSLRVTAVDNGPMDAALLESGLVTHLRADGFRFQPKKPVDWLVCDMVEQPRRVADLVAHWFAQGWCRHAIFNLKLPMKKRYDETLSCLALIEDKAGPNIELRARQLYHDREEITVFAVSGER